MIQYTETELDQLKANEAAIKDEITQLEGSSDPLEQQSVALKKVHLRNIQIEIRKHTPIAPAPGDPLGQDLIDKSPPKLVPATKIKKTTNKK